MQPGGLRGVPRIVDVDRQMRNDELRWRGMFITLLGVSLVFALIGYTSAPEPYPLALLLLGTSCLAAFLRPVIGVYLVLFLGLIGDTVTMAWWPFTKNMSSRESILFVSDQLILSPLEVLAVVTLAAWLLQRLADPTWRFVRGRMFWPIMAFTAFVIMGILYGRVTGGNSRAAVFEFRSLLYIPIIYVLVTNLFTSRGQYRRLLLLSLVSVSIQSVFALVYYRGLPPAEKEIIESLTEHSATVHMNALFVFALCAWLFKCKGWVRWLSLLLAAPTVYAYILSQRRAAMVAMFIGAVVILVVIFYRRRRAFWFCAPTVSILLLGLVLATWNATGPIGLPAQAVKTVLFPDQLGDADRSSDQYRVSESFDLWFTMRAKPLTGLGFGHPFYRPLPLPDISFFEFHEFLPHNSVLWVWVKIGFFGFASMLFMFGRAVQLGSRAAMQVTTPEQAAVVVAGLTYVLMFIVFAYVDIAFGPRTMIFLGFAFAVCADLVGATDDRVRVNTGVHTRQLESVVR